MSEVQRRQEEIIDEFALFDDWTSRYEYIIDLGKSLEPLPEEYKTDDNLVRGCQSRVWLHAEFDGNRIRFLADSDAVITRGLVALMIRVLSNLPPDDIASAELYFIDRIGLKEHLSPTRANGLLAMVKKMKMYALAFSAKTKPQ
ncbi:MAG: SufE family protein [Salibacteraceae bacterium]